MRNEAQLRFIRRGRTDRHAAIDLARIGTHDLRIETLSQLERQRGLSGRSRSGKY